MDHVGHDLGPVLVTGASGYLGARVVAQIATRGTPWAATSRRSGTDHCCDLTDVHAVRALLTRTAPSVVIHCAAIVPRGARDYENARAADASTVMVRNLADHAGCPIVLASSMTVYGDAPVCPVEESSAERPAPEYARGKWDAEQLLFARQRTGDVALRLPGLFGLPRRSGLLYTAAKAFLSRGDFEVAAPAGPWAAMTLQDAAEYVVRAGTIPSSRPAEAVNVSYDGEFTVASAVAAVAAACGIQWSPPAAAGAPFSMRLERLHQRYGTLGVTFPQRLAEFVGAVRQDLLLSHHSAGASGDQ